VTGAKKLRPKKFSNPGGNTDEGRHGPEEDHGRPGMSAVNLFVCCGRIFGRQLTRLLKAVHTGPF